MNSTKWQSKSCELATLAARICPKICQHNPRRAIRIAMELLKEAHEAVKLDAEEFSPQELEAGDRAIDERMAFLDQYLAFVPGVKFITKEKRFDRALPWFRRFIRSRVQTEKKRDAVIAGARAKGFDFYELETLPGYFAEWKAGEKSRTAQRKRGRVRSKGDKRMGARLPSLI